MKRGRPKLQADHPTLHVTVKMSTPMYDQLCAAAQAARVTSVSAMIRQSLQHVLDHRFPPPHNVPQK